MTPHHTVLKEDTIEEVLVEGSIPANVGPAIYGADNDLAD
jgi:hypothetical protein